MSKMKSDNVAAAREACEPESASRELWRVLLNPVFSEEAAQKILSAEPPPPKSAEARDALWPLGEGWVEELAWIRERALSFGLPWWLAPASDAAGAISVSARSDSPARKRARSSMLVKEAGSVLALALCFGEPKGWGSLAGASENIGFLRALRGGLGGGVTRAGEAMAMAEPRVAAEALVNLSEAAGRGEFISLAIPLARGWAAAVRQAGERTGLAELRAINGNADGELAAAVEREARVSRTMEALLSQVKALDESGTRHGDLGDRPELGRALIVAFGSVFWDEYESAPPFFEIAPERAARWADWLGQAARLRGDASWILGEGLGGELAMSDAGAMILCSAFSEGPQAKAEAWSEGGLFDHYFEKGSKDGPAPLAQAMMSFFGAPEGADADRVAERLFRAEKTALGVRVLIHAQRERERDGAWAASAFASAYQSDRQGLGPPDEAREALERWASLAVSQGASLPSQASFSEMKLSWRSIWERAELSSMPARGSRGSRPGL